MSRLPALSIKFGQLLQIGVIFSILSMYCLWPFQGSQSELAGLRDFGPSRVVTVGPQFVIAQNQHGERVFVHDPDNAAALGQVWLLQPGLNGYRLDQPACATEFGE